MRIEGSGFLVTGGGSGLGAGTARMLSEAGGRVVVADVNEAVGEATAAAIGASFVSTDVTDEASAPAPIDAVGDIGGAVNCAGIGIAQRVVSRDGPHPLDLFRRVIDVNLVGTFNVIRLVGVAIAARGDAGGSERGVIVNTASVAAFDGQIGQAAYSASKGGVVGMTLPIARELARYGVRVATIAPGIFDTPMLAGLPEEARISLGGQVPFPPRLGRPDEYAALVRHIVENEMLNGEVIRLDGAIRMAPR